MSSTAATTVIGPGFLDRILEAYRIMHNGAFDPSDWPRSPSAYTPTQHFCRRYRDPERYLTGERINAAITDGDLRPAIGRNAAFVHREAGVAFLFIVDRKQTGLKIVTAWPFLANKGVACESLVWLPEDIERIEHRSARHLTKPEVRETLSGLFDVSLPRNPDAVSFS